MQQRDHPSTDTSPAPSTMRRHRLWDLPPAVHGPLIGLGLLPAELRRSMDRLFRGESGLDDAALHAAVVAQCSARNKVSEALQRAFDARFGSMLAQFRSARTADVVAALWRQALADGSVAAALWSAVTHPCADRSLQTAVCRDVEMALYGAVSGAAARRRHADELLHENGVLAREMARIQERQTRWHADRQAEQAALSAMRLDVIRLQAELAQRNRATQAVPLRADDRPAAERQMAAAAAAAAAAERAPARAPAMAVLHRTPFAACEAPSAAPFDAPSDAGAVPAVGPLVDAVGEARRILCVGGRTGHVPVYRALVEEHGGRFLHHDGGVEDNVRRLDAQLSAADLVICQTGCLSHNAYWRVKDHCKRTRTPCVYLDKPGTGSFLRGLIEGAGATDMASVPAEARSQATD